MRRDLYATHTRQSRTTNLVRERIMTVTLSCERSVRVTRQSRTTNLVRERERELEPPVDDDVQHGAVRAEERRRVAADRGLATGRERRRWRHMDCGGSIVAVPLRERRPMMPFVHRRPTVDRTPFVAHWAGRSNNEHARGVRASSTARLAALGHDRAAADRDRVARRRPPAEPAHGRLDARARQRDEVAVRLEEAE